MVEQDAWAREQSRQVGALSKRSASTFDAELPAWNPPTSNASVTLSTPQCP